MSNEPQVSRPSFDEALRAWKALLAERSLPTNCLWVFDENLCFEPNSAAPGTFKLGYQTRFSPPPQDAEQIAFDYFTEFPSRIIFYRVGSHAGTSICLLLCDEWFEKKGPEEGYFRRDDWRISFRPGGAEEVEEITDEARWKDRMLRRPLHDLDFSMTLRAVHETLAHGRVLSTYEHYALKFLHLWGRMLGQK